VQFVYYCRFVSAHNQHMAANPYLLLYRSPAGDTARRRVCIRYRDIRRSLGIAVLPTQWNIKAQNIKPSHPDWPQLYNHLEELKRRARMAAIANPCNIDAVFAAAMRPTDLTGLDNILSKTADKFDQQHRHGNANAYRDCLKSLHRYAPAIKVLGDITAPNLQDWRMAMINHGLSPATVRVRLSCLRAVWNKCSTDTTVSPFSGLMHPVKGAKHYHSFESIRKIIDMPLPARCNAQRVYRDLFVFSVFSQGMSPVDALHLRKSDIDINARTITYRRYKLRVNTGKIKVYLAGAALDIAMVYMQGNGHYLFDLLVADAHNSAQAHAHYRTVLRLYARALGRIGAKLGIDHLTPYSARHTWAALAEYQGIDLRVIQQLLGHNNLRTTEIYLSDLSHTQLSSAVEKVSGGM
jgi:integrase